MDQKPNPPDDSELESLDEPATTVEGQPNAAQETGVISAESDRAAPVGQPLKPSVAKQVLNKLLSLNIYLILFIFILVVAGAIVLFSYNYSKKKSGDATVKTTSLSQDTLDKLASSDATVGSSSQVLNVQSSAVFAGKVLARSDLEVAGNLQIGGGLNLPSINASESANLGQTTISKNLAVTGDIAVQGQQTIAKSLQVGGSGNFSGNVTAPQISTNSLELNGELVLTRHILAGGGTPNRSNGPALGSGGTVSVSGSDTAGTVTINTGSGTNAGCFATITFATKFNATPHVVASPIGSAAGGLAFYVNRSSTNFSICTNNAAPANASFSFDYIIIG